MCSPSRSRSFFEILQRRHGYAGYGAANVPVRLAAMAQARRVCAGRLKLSGAPAAALSYSRAGPHNRPQFPPATSESPMSKPDPALVEESAPARQGTQEQSRETRQDILRAAIDEFVAQGLSGARVDAIAERTPRSG